MDRKCLEDRMMMTERVKRVIRSRHSESYLLCGSVM